jgi:uncharacterized protein YkwD
MRLVCASIVLAGGLVILSGPALSATPKNGTRLAARTVLAEINTVRAHFHLRGLQMATKLSAPADAHTQEMGKVGYFAHESADGTSFWKRVARYYSPRGYRHWMVGENLLWSSGTLTPASAVQMWMQSPEHRRNLLDSRWRQIGLSVRSFASAPGVFSGLDVTIVSADFGARY